DEVKVKTLLTRLRGKDATDRQMAVRALNELGPEAKVAIPLLVDALSDTQGESRQIVTNVLSRIGKSAVPALTMALKKEDKGTRRQAAIALGKIGADAKPASAALAELITSEKDREIRSFALNSLIQVDAEPTTLIPVVKRVLKDDDKGVRIAAIYALE